MKKVVNKSDNKKIRNAAKVEIDGIKFRSKIEAFTYRKLVEAGITNFRYEEDTFSLQGPFQYPYGLYDNGISDSTSVRAITYTPDFVCIDGNQKGWILEIKGYANDVFPLKWKMFKHYLDTNGYDITLFKANNQGNVLKSIDIIKEKYYK